MSANEISEKIYYSDALLKVTNVRVTCNHITVPVEKIESVNVNFKIEAFSFSVLVFLSSFTPFMFFEHVPEIFEIAFLFFGTLLIAASFLWLIMVYSNYIELIVTVGGRRLVILGAHMKKNEYVCKVATAIEESIFDEKKYRKLKKEIVELEPSAAFNSSETMRLKLILEDYEKLKSMKNELLKAKGQ